MFKLLKKLFSFLFSTITADEDYDVIPLIPLKKRVRKKKMRMNVPEAQKEV